MAEMIEQTPSRVVGPLSKIRSTGFDARSAPFSLQSRLRRLDAQRLVDQARDLGPVGAAAGLAHDRADQGADRLVVA
jgi:hypothetical protein